MPFYKQHAFQPDEDFARLMRFFVGALLALTLLMLCMALLPFDLNRRVFIVLNLDTYRQWPESRQWVWNGFWHFITELGDLHVMVWLLIWIILPQWLKPTLQSLEKTLILTGFSLLLLGAGLLAQGIKKGLGALRPLSVLPQEFIHVIGPELYHSSFPSGHTVTAFAAAAALCPLLNRAGRFFVLILATLIGLSRITVGAHWPLDVLAGAFIGILTAMACWQALIRWQARAQATPTPSIPLLTTKIFSRLGLGLLGINVLYTPFYRQQHPMLWLLLVLGITLGIVWFARQKSAD